MGARTGAREAALQMLFAADVAASDAEIVVEDFWREFPGDAEDRAYADAALRGVLIARGEIDDRIRAQSQNWRLERMSAVTRNVLRLGTWELMSRPEVPRAVIIDEAVELAKRYDSQKSAAFVNGLLDQLANVCGRVDTDRPARREVPEAEPQSDEPQSDEPQSDEPRTDGSDSPRD